MGRTALVRLLVASKHSFLILEKCGVFVMVVTTPFGFGRVLATKPEVRLSTKNIWSKGGLESY